MYDPKFNNVILSIVKRLIPIVVIALLLQGCSDSESDRGCQSDNPDALQVLFVGNSFTSNNNLPGMLCDLAAAAGLSIVTDAVTQGGHTLERHADDQATQDKILGNNWAYVILQEQSRLPGTTDRPRMVQAAIALDEHIRQVGARPLLFLTWGYRDDEARAAGFQSFSHMQRLLRDGYELAADAINAEIAPVGSAWERARDQRPALNLWSEDGQHPGVAGTYLAACVFFAHLFNETSVGLSFQPSGLSNSDATFLQRMADQTVF